MATTPEQIEMVTAGSTSHLPDWVSQTGQKMADDKVLKNIV
jgi:hypothetical protein